MVTGALQTHRMGLWGRQAGDRGQTAPPPSPKRWRGLIRGQTPTLSPHPRGAAGQELHKRALNVNYKMAKKLQKSARKSPRGGRGRGGPPLPPRGRSRGGQREGECSAPPHNPPHLTPSCKCREPRQGGGALPRAVLGAGVGGGSHSVLALSSSNVPTPHLSAHRRRWGTALVTSRKKGWLSAALAEMRLLGS